MASQKGRKPVLAGTGSVASFDRGKAFNTAEYNEIDLKPQAKRMTGYVVDQHLVVVEVHHE